MVKHALLAVCSFGFGVALMDQLAEKPQTEEKAEVKIPLAFPLGCPIQDEHGRSLKLTMYVSGERKQRCYYK